MKSWQRWVTVFTNIYLIVPLHKSVVYMHMFYQTANKSMNPTKLYIRETKMATKTNKKETTLTYRGICNSLPRHHPRSPSNMRCPLWMFWETSDKTRWIDNACRRDQWRWKGAEIDVALKFRATAIWIKFVFQSSYPSQRRIYIRRLSKRGARPLRSL